MNGKTVDYRAWDKDNCIMFQPIMISMINGEDRIEAWHQKGQASGNGEWKDNIDLMEYVQKDDVDGTRMYDRDIIQLGDNDNQIAIIKWFPSSATYKCQIKDKDPSPSNFSGLKYITVSQASKNGCKVIGNIYNIPEIIAKELSLEINNEIEVVISCENCKYDTPRHSIFCSICLFSSNFKLKKLK